MRRCAVPALLCQRRSPPRWYLFGWWRPRLAAHLRLSALQRRHKLAEAGSLVYNEPWGGTKVRRVREEHVASVATEAEEECGGALTSLGWLVLQDLTWSQG